MNQFDPICTIPQHSLSYTRFFSFEASKWTLSYGVRLQNGANASISLMRASRSDGSNLLSTAPETLLRHDQTRR
jgi:hypothetical protein